MPAHTFITRICPITLSWNETGLTDVRLHALSEHVPPTSPDGRPEWVRHLAADLVAHMNGECRDFTSVPIDYEPVGDFSRQVYEELRTVPAGQTVTYSELAARVERPLAARAAARAMATNRWPMIVPCHRVLRSGGGLGGFSGANGIASKAQILKAEGVSVAVPPAGDVAGSIFAPYMWDVAVHSLSTRDSRFADIARKVAGQQLTQSLPGNPFAFLVRTVCYQQLAGAAARTIFGRLEAQLNGRITPESVLLASRGELASAGLSASKTATIIGLAEAVQMGTLQVETLSQLPYDELKATLTSYKGLGPWTVEMFAIFHLGLPDIFSPSDLGVRKALARLTGKAGLPSVEEAKRIGNRWKPFRTVATWHLWRSLDVVTM